MVALTYLQCGSPTTFELSRNVSPKYGGQRSRWTLCTDSTALPGLKRPGSGSLSWHLTLPRLMAGEGTYSQTKVELTDPRLQKKKIFLLDFLKLS